MGGARKLVTVVQSGLADELRAIRNDCGMSLEVVCNKLRWQQSKLSRMETGDQCISDVDLGALLAIYEVHGDERRRLLRMAERQDDPGYWAFESPSVSGIRVLKRLEPKTTAIVDAEPMMVPGLLQTAEYVRAVMAAGDLPPEQIEARVDVRMSRQFILTKDKPPKFDMIMDEIVLRRVTGDRKIMARQLRAMLEIADLPNVRLWVVPFDRGANAGFIFPFHLMDLQRGKSVVLLESQNSAVFLEDQKKIDFFRHLAAKLVKVALDPAKSADFIATIAKGHEKE